MRVPHIRFLKIFDVSSTHPSQRTLLPPFSPNSPDPPMHKLKNMKSESLTLLLVNLAGIMERADESLLLGIYKEVGKALHTDPTGLGSLTLFRSMVQCLCYPLAAYLSARQSRTHVIALGAFLWSAATFLPRLLRLIVLFYIGIKFGLGVPCFVRS